MMRLCAACRERETTISKCHQAILTLLVPEEENLSTCYRLKGENERDLVAKNYCFENTIGANSGSCS
jgi:hypothetical protein